MVVVASAAVAWVLRHWLMRTARTVLALAVAITAVVAGALVPMQPAGWVIGSVVGTAALWLVLIQHPLFWAMKEADYRQVEQLQSVDAEARRLLSTVDDDNVAAVHARLQELRRTLATAPAETGIACAN